MNPLNVIVWITFYFVVIMTLLYFCFRRSMSTSLNNSETRTIPTTYSASSNRRTNERRTALRSGRNRSIFVITEENEHRPSDASHIRSPPEYKWEDLPPSYEEAVESFTNPTFDDQQQPNTCVVRDSTVIIPESAASVN